MASREITQISFITQALENIQARKSGAKNFFTTTYIWNVLLYTLTDGRSFPYTFLRIPKIHALYTLSTSDLFLKLVL